MKRFWLLSAALAGSLTLAAAGFSPWDAWKNGYTLYEKGEQFRDKGDYLKALNSFEQAKKLYEQLQKNRPDWNQKIITGRIADCDREITAVKRLVGDSELTSPAASAPTGADFAEQQSLRRELEQYKQKLSEIIVENDDLRRRLARNQASQKEVANLLREQRVMQEKYALLEKRYQDLERQSLEPDQRLTELRNQLIEEKLNAELTAKRLKVAETRLQKLDQDAVELYRARSKAEAAAKEREADATRLERELAELRRFQANAAGERSALQNRLDQANLQLKEQQAQIGSQENDLQNLRRQLQDTLKNGGDSVTLNAQLLDENRKLRESLTELQGAAATSQEQNTQLQNKQRDLQLELVQVRDLLQRLEATRTRLEAEKGELLKTLEREKGGAELASVELKNQRERIARLESDIQTWSDRCNRLEKRLAERKQEDYDAIAASDAAKRKLSTEISLLKGQIAELTVNKQDMETASAKLKKEFDATHETLLKTQAARLHLEGRLKKLETETAGHQKLQADFKALQVNFNALQAENSANKKLAAQLASAQKQLTALQTRLADFDKTRQALARQQRENQALAEAKLKLEAELAARPVIRQAAEPEVAVLPRIVTAKGNPDELVAAGQKAEQEESTDLAIWNYRTALELDPSNAAAASRLGMIHLKREEFNRALPLLDIARRATPDDPELTAAAAAALNGQEKYGNALALLEPLRKKYPDDLRLLLPFAKAQAGSGQLKIAGELYRQAEKLAPASPLPKLELARLYLQGDKPDEAAAARLYQAARKLGAGPDLELEPRLGKLIDENRQVTEFMTSAAQEAARNNDWSSAAWYFKQLLERDRNSAENAVRLAFAQYKSGQLPAALETLSMNTASLDGLLLAALLRFRSDDFEGAATAAAEAVKQNGGKSVKASPQVAAEAKQLLAGSDAKRSVLAQKAAAAIRAAIQK